MAIPLVTLPRSVLHGADILTSILFVALPIVALYAGANFKWNLPTAAGTTILGFALQFFLAKAAEGAKNPFLGNSLFTFSQAGLLIWCLGLGALVASMIKDCNLLLPLSIFLALFDFWLVFCPEGVVGKIARESGPTMLKSFGYRVPTVAPTLGGHIQPAAYVGPADFMFLAMFFVALYRFGMDTRRTFLAIVPVLVLYMLAVLLFGGITIGPVSLAAMPALLPIGIVVLVANWKSFKLSKDERLSTAVLTVAGIALVSWRMALHWHDLEQPAEPLNQGPDQVAPGPPDSPSSPSPDRSQPLNPPV